mgnify:CR=1 FL=1
MMMDMERPLPQPTKTTEPFWRAAREHRLELQRCKRTGRAIFYPRPVCPEHLSADCLEWFTASGRGKVYSFTRIHQAMHPAFTSWVPYIFAIVELEEGVRMATNIVECGMDEVSCDMAVEVVFEDVNAEISLPKFRPVRR